MHRFTYLLVAVVACSETHDTYEPFEIAELPRTPFDLLVVLDDTTAMANHLPRQPPPGQIGVPVYFYNGAPDMRIAVTTTTTGTLRTSPLVPNGIIEHTLSFEDGTLKTSYAGTLPDAIASLMNVGTSSTSSNAILASTASALSSGFVRDGAAVGVMISTAGDDQSPNEARSYADEVYAVASRVGISVVNVDPVPRLSEFADSFATRNFMPMGEYNMSAVEVFAGLFWTSPPVSCFPLAPQDVASCEVFTSFNHVVTALPSCEGTALASPTPCWQVVDEPTCASGRVLLLGGGYQMYHPQIFGRCRI